MKKAIGLIFSGIIMLPAIALGASAVKALGGAGTYSGVTSVGTSAKTGTRVLRAGSVRTPAVKSVSTISSSNVNSVAKSGTTTTASGNNQNRMSIGKYLSGTGIVSSSSSGSTAGVPSRKTDELEQDIQSLHDKLSDLEQAGYITSSDIDEYLKNADLNLDGYVTDEELGDYVKSDQLSEFLTNADLTGYAKSTDLEGFLTDADLSSYAKSTDLEGFLTDAKLAEKGFLTDDITNPYVKTNDLNTQVASQVTSELQGRDLVTSEGLNTSLDGYVQKDTLEQLAYRSYVDTIVNNLNTTQADVNSLSQQIQNIQVSNMPDVPTCSGGSCTYMLLDNGGETKTWKEMSVVDEFNADQMN